MDTTPMMGCGHAANATSQGKPSCAICAGLNEPAAHTIVVAPPLYFRKMKCAYGCGPIKPSTTEAAFFEYRPQQDFDIYYCGCHGWD